MNNASLRSARLQRVLKILKDGRWHSTWEIMSRGKVCAVSACISELRCLGARIETEVRLDGPELERRWFYRMTKAPKQKAPRNG